MYNRSPLNPYPSNAAELWALREYEAFKMPPKMTKIIN